MEPFFSVVMSWLFLGSTPTLPLMATLVPIVGGVALASFSVRLPLCCKLRASPPPSHSGCTPPTTTTTAQEPSFNWNGFIAAMASNVTFQAHATLPLLG